MASRAPEGMVEPRLPLKVQVKPAMMMRIFRNYGDKVVSKREM
jgi:hypothetical protein